jgi:hypothetical protein
MILPDRAAFALRETEVLFMKNVLVKKVAAAVAAGAMLISSTAFAAPVTSANATLEKAAPGQTTNVYYRRWGRGPWIGAAIVGGALAGAAIANANRPYYYYDPYYGSPAYAEPGSYYYAEPGYYYDAPPPPAPPGPAYPRRCWIEGGVNQQSGYWTPC